jgi:hypothetical protein
MRFSRRTSLSSPPHFWAVGELLAVGMGSMRGEASAQALPVAAPVAV